MAAVMPFLPLITAGVSLVGGAITGNKQAKQNQQYIQSQDRQLAQVAQFAQQIATSVQRADYEAQATRDVNATLQDVFGAMAQRGMGRSTAGLTAAADASGKIRTTYTQQYLQDRLGALQTAGSMVSGVANAPRMGYDSNPFAAMQAGMGQLGNALGYYQQNGWPKWGTSGGSSTASPYFGVNSSAPGLGVSTAPSPFSVRFP